MSRREKVIEIDVKQPIDSVCGLTGYDALWALIRFHDEPLGYVRLSVTQDTIGPAELGKSIIDMHSTAIIYQALKNWIGLAPAVRKTAKVEDLFKIEPRLPHRSYPPYPRLTVAVCTRNRTSDLKICLEALAKIKYPHLEILVVDNCPTDKTTQRLVKEDFDAMRYVREPRPGLNWARNRAVVEARGEIIAFTDDDTVVDPKWAHAIAQAFTDNREVMAVTGLVLPYELETHAQKLFESFGGFGRGFERKWVRADKRDRWYWGALGTGQFGTGANMAFRRKVFDEIGLFDPALDVGTVTNGGGDLEMFFRVLNTGHTLAYEPAAIVRHRHRRKLIQLRTQLKNNGCGLFSYIFRSVRFHPDQIRFFARLSLWYLLKGNLKPFLKSPLKMGEIPRIFYLDQLLGSFQGALAYWRSQNKAQNIERKFGPVTAGAAYKALSPRIRKLTKPDAIGIRQIDLVLPLMALNDVKDYATVRVFVRDGDHHLGSLDISNDGQTISANRLREEIVRSFGLNLLDPSRRKSKMSVWSKVVSALSDHLIPSDSDRQRQNHPRDSAAERISVVVATLDRPADLGACLQHLLAQKTTSEVEIIVVDNNPASGLTAPVVAQYPGVALVKEPRKGLAYARNAGFLHCTGEIAVATDDDVTMPEDWLRKLTAPFARPEVMIVTGNVLPLEIENRAQALFERYGGLGRGFERFEIGPDWFGSIYGQAVPTWTLGATANAAFRTCIFKDPQIGLMEETLGPGMPSGVGEDTYLFYKVLKAGHIIAYEPAAFVWHKHRRDMNGLRHQLYNYSKGHVAYHLTTFMNDCDVRALLQIFVQLPLWRLKQLLWYAKSLLKGNEPDYPFSLTLTEIIGNAVGPFVLWKSHQRVKREGRSVSRGCKRAKFRPSEIN